MMRISLLKIALRTLLCFTLFGSSFTLQGQGLIIDMPTSISGDTVYAQVQVFNFANVASVQYTISWDVNEMTFHSVDNFNLPGLSGSNFGTTLINNGLLTHSWIDPATLGLSVPDCSTLFTIKFLSVAGNTTPLSIVDDPTDEEIIDGDFNPIPWDMFPLACGDNGFVSGNIYNDLSEDCLLDAGENGIQNQTIVFEGSGQTFYANTNALGEYSIYLYPGEYDVSLYYFNTNVWTTCVPLQTITIAPNGSSILDFPMQALVDCPLMTVDISASFLRRCFPSRYYVQYCNQGTVLAPDAYIEVTFDSLVAVTGSSIPWTTVDGQTYTFPVGDVPVGACQTFSVDVDVLCDAVLGQTHCSSAHAFPDNPCLPSINWDGSDLEITGTCDGDSVRFEIINNGDDMSDPMEFIVIEDDMIHLTSDPILLLSQETVQLSVEANGATWRVEMPETPNNPFSTFTTAAIEGCGTNGGGTFSLGFVTQFPQDDESLAIDTDCQENIGSYDPNDKTGYPKGFCNAQYIRANQDIEYRIRFQNTGTDTAFNIVITDTLSNFLSPASVRPGTSSHPYEFELLGEGALKFTFPNIMLPDSNINEPASHGFVNFTIEQGPGNANGTIIENYADIFFDFNAPIRTNTVRHTIGDDFVEMQSQVGDLNVRGNVSTWYGDPIEEAEMIMTNICPVYTDANGDFAFENIDTANYSLLAYKINTLGAEGITVLDMVKIRQSILGFGEPLNIYQAYASDLNGSFGTTTFDLVLMQKIILQIDDVQQNWTFLTANSTMANPMTAYQYVPLEENLNNQDFLGIQPGNVITEDMVETSPIETAYYMESTINAEGLMEIAFKANQFTKVNGFQFGVSWDSTKVIVKEFLAGAFPLNNLIQNNIHLPDAGQLVAAWLSSSELSLDDGETLFTMVMEPIAPEGTTVEFMLNENLIPLQTVLDDCKLSGNQFENLTTTIQGPNAVIDFGSAGLQVKVTPNPIQQGDLIRLETSSDQQMKINVALFDIGGTLLEDSELLITRGTNYYSMNTTLKKGIYFLRISNEKGQTRTAKVTAF